VSAQDYESAPGEDVFGAPWPEDPRLQEQQMLEAEGPAESGPDPEPVPKPVPFSGSEEHDVVRSAVKVTKTTRGTTFEVRVLVGDSEAALDEARRIALQQYRALSREFSPREASS